MNSKHLSCPHFKTKYNLKCVGGYEGRYIPRKFLPAKIELLECSKFHCFSCDPMDFWRDPITNREFVCAAGFYPVARDITDEDVEAGVFRSECIGCDTKRIGLRQLINGICANYGKPAVQILNPWESSIVRARAFALETYLHSKDKEPQSSHCVFQNSKSDPPVPIKLKRSLKME